MSSYCWIFRCQYFPREKKRQRLTVSLLLFPTLSTPCGVSGFVLIIWDGKPRLILFPYLIFKARQVGITFVRKASRLSKKKILKSHASSDALIYSEPHYSPVVPPQKANNQSGRRIQIGGCVKKVARSVQCPLSTALHTWQFPPILFSQKSPWVSGEKNTAHGKMLTSSKDSSTPIHQMSPNCLFSRGIFLFY